MSCLVSVALGGRVRRVSGCGCEGGVWNGVWTAAGHCGWTSESIWPSRVPLAAALAIPGNQWQQLKARRASRCLALTAKQRAAGKFKTNIVPQQCRQMNGCVSALPRPRTSPAQPPDPDFDPAPPPSPTPGTYTPPRLFFFLPFWVVHSRGHPLPPSLPPVHYSLGATGEWRSRREREGGIVGGGRRAWRGEAGWGWALW